MSEKSVLRSCRGAQPSIIILVIGLCLEYKARFDKFLDRRSWQFLSVAPFSSILSILKKSSTELLFTRTSSVESSNDLYFVTRHILDLINSLLPSVFMSSSLSNG